MTYVLGLERRKNAYKISKAKAWERKFRDLSHFGCIKNDDEKVLTQYDEILNEWMKYFSRKFKKTHKIDKFKKILAK